MKGCHSLQRFEGVSKCPLQVIFVALNAGNWRALAWLPANMNMTPINSTGREFETKGPNQIRLLEGLLDSIISQRRRGQSWWFGVTF